MTATKLAKELGDGRDSYDWCPGWILYTSLYLWLKDRGMMYLQSHRPSWFKCFAEMKYRTSIYYLLAVIHENILIAFNITVYMRHHNLLHQKDASVLVRGH